MSDARFVNTSHHHLRRHGRHHHDSHARPPNPQRRSLSPAARATAAPPVRSYQVITRRSLLSSGLEAELSNGECGNKRGRRVPYVLLVSRPHLYKSPMTHAGDKWAGTATWTRAMATSGRDSRSSFPLDLWGRGSVFYLSYDADGGGRQRKGGNFV